MAAPEKIYLQTDNEGESMDSADFTWCVDQINETDTTYIRADLHTALEQQVERLEGRLDGLREEIKYVPSIFETDNAIEVAQWFMQAIDKALASQEEARSPVEP